MVLDKKGKVKVHLQEQADDQDQVGGGVTGECVCVYVCLDICVRTKHRHAPILVGTSSPSGDKV